MYLKTLKDIPVQNGIVRETYSLTMDPAGEVFLQNVLDADVGAPTDTMHIDPQAFGPLAEVFAMLARTELTPAPVRVDIPAPAANVIAFRKIIPGSPRSADIRSV